MCTRLCAGLCADMLHKKRIQSYFSWAPPCLTENSFLRDVHCATPCLSKRPWIHYLGCILNNILKYDSEEIRKAIYISCHSKTFLNPWFIDQNFIFFIIISCIFFKNKTSNQTISTFCKLCIKNPPTKKEKKEIFVIPRTNRFIKI